eukprot:TRINITY_DN9794_c0_g1_i2.p1 TRINITY_DN9794_c0_g1~~TRINITY_DN9794_c0_g1_i2.p1  ORF type:complete len:362 (-),score=68.38 TRINITY_DN9794_c0_g1_i2:71-1156(-)
MSQDRKRTREDPPDIIASVVQPIISSSETQARDEQAGEILRKLSQQVAPSPTAAAAEKPAKRRSVSGRLKDAPSTADSTADFVTREDDLDDVTDVAPSAASLQNIQAAINQHRFPANDVQETRTPKSQDKKKHSTSREELRDACHELGEILSRKYGVLVRRHGARYNANAVMRLILQSLGSSDGFTASFTPKKPTTIGNVITIPPSTSLVAALPISDTVTATPTPVPRTPITAPPPPPPEPTPNQEPLVATTPGIQPGSTLTAQKHSRSREDLRQLCDHVGEVLQHKYGIQVRKHGGRHNANAVAQRLLTMLGDKDGKPAEADDKKTTPAVVAAAPATLPPQQQLVQLPTGQAEEADERRS